MCGVFYSHLVNIVVIWYIFSLFGIPNQEKSGNPDMEENPAVKFRLCNLLLLAM
jgi:hypothetical protein